MVKKVQLQDLETSENVYPLTDIESVDGLEDRLKAVEEREDKDTIFDPSDIESRLDALENGQTGGDFYTKGEIDEKLDNIVPGALVASNYGETFEEALNACLAELKKRGTVSTIDCTNFTGNITCENRFIIDVPCTILLGNAKITMKDTSFFVIKSNGVNIIGLNRQSDFTTDDRNSTDLIMNNVSTVHEEGYHIYSRGYKNCSYKNLTLRGRRSSIESQENNDQYPIDGVGGIYIEKENPGKTESGNTCNNITIENVFIYDTKAAAIYMDTPILSTLRQVRITGAGGHGIYINGGTSLLMESCYVASANYAGVCLSGVTYASVTNSCCETCSLGWWIRSCSNVTLTSPGVESTTYLKNKPWTTQYSITKRYGKGLVTKDKSGAAVKISDVPDDAWTLNGKNFVAQNLFIGYGYVITGGKAINIFAPYATNIAETSKQNAAITEITPNLAYVMVLGNARSVNIINFGNNETSTRSKFTGEQLVHEVIIGDGPSNLDFSFDSENTALQNYSKMLTTNYTERAPIYNEGKNSLIHSGATYYEFINFGDNAKYDDTELRGRVGTLESDVEELKGKEDKDTVYDDSELRGRIEELESKEDKDTIFDPSDIERRLDALESSGGTGGDSYDDTELRGRVEELESKEDKDTIYDDSELRERVDEIDDALFEVTETSTVEYVDLGLPSGLLWATCNLGAEKETDGGLYFQWGDVKGYKGGCSREESTTDNNETHFFDWGRYKYSNGGINSLSKYNHQFIYGIPDYRSILVSSDDAATAMLGETWRMPTVEEFKELLDNTVPGEGSNEYGWIKNYKETGVNGLLLKSNTNNNSIFFPAAGYCFSDTYMPKSIGDDCSYWSSSLYKSACTSSQTMRALENIVNTNISFRTYGLPIRGVSMSPTTQTKTPKFTTKEYVGSEIEKSGEVIKEEISKSLADKANTSDVYTKDEIERKHFADKDWVEEQGYLTEHQSLQDYPTKSEVTQQIIDITTEGKVDLNGYATEDWVHKQNYVDWSKFIPLSLKEYNDLGTNIDKDAYYFIVDRNDDFFNEFNEMKRLYEEMMNFISSFPENDNHLYGILNRRSRWLTELDDSRA